MTRARAAGPPQHVPGGSRTSLDRVVLVDASDRVVGSASKVDAHRSGTLHRAFSVFLFDSEGALLLQQRARRKYHSGGLWTNTCCGHPRPGEITTAAARRRLREEMGVDCALEEAGSFLYRAAVGHGLQEHELDHVLVGLSDDEPVPDPLEVGGWRRVRIPDLHQERARTPKRFTAWFAQALEIALRASLLLPSADALR